ncbi:hypothetical protein RHGRI_036266 [Rhododendron griersonianum]|uniref:RRM domain-containing protein n=1 Tax=Rhododendron griersonianum TaxID=479676 RepID=A0AAV6HQU0_9ERIC|nr:hypothetical protein RHGRI_036266 [Rhododendron griersonianum]
MFFLLMFCADVLQEFKVFSFSFAIRKTVRPKGGVKVKVNFQEPITVLPHGLIKFLYLSRDASIENPGNNLYVTGLSARVSKRDLEKHFSNEGKVEDIHLVIDPWTRESRGFGFVTMSTVEEADRCVKYLDRSVLEGRVITVERAKRRRGRTPTPGRYLGLRTVSAQRRSPSYSLYSRSRSPRYSSERERTRSPSPCYGRYRRGRSYSRSSSPYSRSPVSRRDRSDSPYRSRHRQYSPDNYHYRRSRCHQSAFRSISPRVRRGSRRNYSRSVSPRPRRSMRRSYSPSISPRRSRRSYSRSISPVYRRSSRRSYSRSICPVYRRSSRRSYSRSVSPSPRRRSRRSAYRGSSRRHGYDRDGYSSRSYSRSPIESPYSRSVTPTSASPSP